MRLWETRGFALFLRPPKNHSTIKPSVTLLSHCPLKAGWSRDDAELLELLRSWWKYLLTLFGTTVCRTLISNYLGFTLRFYSGEMKTYVFTKSHTSVILGGAMPCSTQDLGLPARDWLWALHRELSLHCWSAGESHQCFSTTILVKAVKKTYSPH